MSWGEVLKINSDMSKPLDTLISEVVSAKSIVKSIQRGRSLAPVSGDGMTIQNLTLAIAAVTVSKCMILLNNASVQEAGGYIVGAYPYSITTNSVSFYPHFHNGGGNPSPKYFYWQVVEFY